MQDKCDCGKSETFFHSRCCSAHFEGVIYENGKWAVVCEKCRKFGAWISEKPILDSARIEAAIRKLRKPGRGERGEDTVSIYTGRQVALILEYAFGISSDKKIAEKLAGLFDMDEVLDKVTPNQKGG